MTAPEPTPAEPSSLVESLKNVVRFFQYQEPSHQGHSSKDKQPDFDPSEVFDLLKPERRQAVMDVLENVEKGPISVSTLAEEVAAIEYNCPPTELGSQQRKRVYIALCQVHLPRLAEAQIVSYDDNQKLVDEGPRFSELRRVYSILTDALTEKQ
ncbi:hypothetical protein ACFQL3_02180 [Natronoarchaeum sp. GCM10025321]|uniref:DUF7344 domain-containing protein n=2 Tax=unclassified Natronoarchaeum TaxID=2620183 RepID=UPI003609955E